MPALKCLIAAERLGLEKEKVKSLKARLEKESGEEAGAALPGAAVEVLKEGLASLKV